MRYFSIVLVTFTFLIFPSIADAQITFEKWYGGASSDVGYSVAQTSDGGYIIAGKTDSYGAGGWDVYLIKTDSLGDTTWTKTYGGTDHEMGHSVAQTTDGGYIVVGSGNLGIYLIKTDAVGDTTWTKSFGGIGYAVAQTSYGGYIITGSYGGDVYLMKTNANGDSIWTRTFDGSDVAYGYSVIQTFDEGYIITGWARPYGPGSANVYLIKTDSLGDTTWTKMYGDSTNSTGQSVSQTSDGGYIIAGNITPFYFPDVYLIKTNESGDTIWTKSFGSIDGWDEGYSVAQTADGGYIVTGFVETTYMNRDVYLIKTDATGDSLWTKRFGSSNNDEGYSVAQTADGGYIIAGFTQSFGAGGHDVYLIKTDANGLVGIKEQTDPRPESRDMRLVVQPNPFITSAAITIEGISEHQNTRLSDLQIYDASGRLVKSVKLTTNSCQLGADLIPGIYFLKADGKYVGKVVKVR